MTEQPEHIMQFFAYDHLPPHLQETSKAFAVMAEAIVNTLPRNPERTVALRKLLESKDAAVRAKLAKGIGAALLCLSFLTGCSLPTADLLARQQAFNRCAVATASLGLDLHKEVLATAAVEESKEAAAAHLLIKAAPALNDTAAKDCSDTLDFGLKDLRAAGDRIKARIGK